MNQKHNEAQTPKNPAGDGKKKHHKPNGGGKPNSKPQGAKPAGNPNKGGQPKKGVQSLQDLASLVRMAPRGSKKPAHSIRAPLPNLMSYKGDGEDHINISTEAKTELGKLLCSASYLPFEHPVLGKFASIMAFNFYIVSAERDDRMRNATPKELRLLADAGTKVTVQYLWTLIFYATWIQVKSYPALVEALKTNELPFDLYKQKNYRGMPASLYRPDLHDVSLEIIDAISKAIKSGKPPAFRSTDLAKMIKLSEEFATIGMAKRPEDPVAVQTAALLKGSEKAVGEDIDRIHEQLQDGAEGHATIVAPIAESTTKARHPADLVIDQLSLPQDAAHSTTVNERVYDLTAVYKCGATAEDAAGVVYVTGDPLKVDVMPEAAILDGLREAAVVGHDNGSYGVLFNHVAGLIFIGRHLYDVERAAPAAEAPASSEAAGG